MSANLVTNINLAIENKNVKSVTGWADSTVVLHSLNQRAKYKQIVVNRDDKIRQKNIGRQAVERDRERQRETERDRETERQRA